MKKSTKIWLIIAAILVLAGGGLCLGMMCALDWDFTALSAAELETNTHTLPAIPGSITVDTDTANIRFVPAEDESCTVVCYEETNAPHHVSLEGGALTIRAVNEKKWYEYIGLSFGTPEITVYLPAGQYEALTIESSTGDIDVPGDFSFRRVQIAVDTGDVTCRVSAAEALRIAASTGDICVEGASADAMVLEVSTGHVTVSDAACAGEIHISVSTGKAALYAVTCGSLISTGSTGDVTLSGVVAEGAMSIRRSTGHIRFDRCDAGEITAETDTGHITGTLLTEKIFIAETSTGHMDVPRGTSGGVCQITTSTGDIRIDLAD